MTKSEVLRSWLLPGSAAGLAGGIPIGIALLGLDLLPFMAGLVRAESVAAGFIVVLIAAVLIGGGFGGILTAARLREQGMEDIRIIDSAGDFGVFDEMSKLPHRQRAIGRFAGAHVIAKSRDDIDN